MAKKKLRYAKKPFPDKVTLKDKEGLQRFLPYALGDFQWLMYRGRDRIMPYTLEELAEVACRDMKFIKKMMNLKIIYKSVDLDDGPVYAISTEFIITQTYISPIDAIAEAERIVADGGG